MHKFIVNNRIRSDPAPHPQLASNNDHNNNKQSSSHGSRVVNMNAMMKFKMALPPLSTHLVQSVTDDNKRNQCNDRTQLSSSSSSASSAISSNCTNTSIDSKGTKGVQFGDKETATKSIRMSGYLKKKRNRVGGGWRKLWFVLQNQLLLSYSSKEDYEKKLAPFKDLINLVPGTVIKPAAGARFTIETTANVVYTFRCDNNKVCSDWITTICECLGIKTRRRSLGCLTTSQKWTLTRSNKRVPKLPIAKNTARILQKGIIEEPINHIVKAQQDFRLHQSDLVLNNNSSQFSDVSRINRMFRVVQQPLIPKAATISDKSDKSEEPVTVQRIITGRSIAMEPLSECNSLEEQMQCITIEDSSLGSIPNDELSFVEPIYAVIDLNQKHRRREKLSKQLSTEEPHSSLQQAKKDEGRPASIATANSVSTSSVSSVNITTEMPQADKPPSPGYSYIREFSDYNNNNNNNHRKSVEGEYAKIVHRGRPKSFHNSSGDYEEVHHFPHLQLLKDDSETEENIYEPINVDVMPGKNLWWSYFPKINIDTISDMGRRRHHHSSSSPAINTSNTNGAPANGDPTSTPSSACSTTSSSGSSFSEMRKKLGTHRKSLKSRVKRMYSRSQTAVAFQTGRLLGMARRNYINHSGQVDNDNNVSSRISESSSTIASEDLSQSQSQSPSPPPLPDLPKRYLKQLEDMKARRRIDEEVTVVIGNEVDESKKSRKGKELCHSKFYDGED